MRRPLLVADTGTVGSDRPGTGRSGPTRPPVTQKALPLDHLVSPYGLVSALIRAQPTRGLPGLSNITGVLGRQATAPGRQPRTDGGSGRTLDDPGLAVTVAIAEAAERYAGNDVHDQAFEWSTAAELPGRVIDLDRIPLCSATEYATPGCPLVPFDPGATIRWLSGTDLLTGERTWVPAVMACFGLCDLVPAERFWYRISTGYAVHVDPVEALIGGVCEVIERDIIAILWLQRLGLPRLPEHLQSDAARRLVGWAERHFIRTLLLDATSDLGVPTVYCLQIAEHDATARQIAGCSTGDTLARAAEKALLEAGTIRGLYASTEPLPPPVQFTSTMDGARYMAVPERADAFDFLLSGSESAPGAGTLAANPLGGAAPGDRAAALRRLLDVLRERNMQAIVVDRTTDELRAVGLTAVCVVIPDLMPMTLHPYAQFRAHPRLYSAPLAMGHPSRPEAELNPWPQPFA